MKYLHVWGLVSLLALSFWVNASKVSLWYDPFVGTDIDEVVMHYEMREWLLKGTPAESRKLAGYPPVTLIAHYAGHIVMASAAGDWSASYAFEVINLLRWWAVFPAMIASALIYRAIRLYVSVPVAVIVLIVWLLSPLISLERTNAITEPWQLLFVSAALLTFLLAVRDRDMRWSVLSTVFGCLAVAAKYSNFPILGLSAAAAFWILLHDWRRSMLPPSTMIIS